MSTGVSDSSSNPMNGYNAWENALKELQNEITKMGQQIKNDVALISKLEGERNDLENKLHNSPAYQKLLALEEEAEFFKEFTGKVPSDIQKAIDALKGQIAPMIAQIGEMSQQISKAQGQLSQDKETLTDDREKLTKMNGNSSSNANQNEAVNKTLKQTAQEVQDQSQKQQNAAAQRKAALNAIQNEIELELATAQDAVLRIGNIKKDKEQIAKDKAEITKLKHEITECAIKLAAATAAAGFWAPWMYAVAAYYAHELAGLVNEKNSVENDLHHTQDDLKVQEADLKADMSKLQKMSLGDLNKLIDSLFKEIGKLVALLGKGGKASQGTMQQASLIIAQVMAIVEMITAKVHQMRSTDQQWMSRGSAANSEVQAVQSQINVVALTALEAYATFMKAVMTGVQVVADVAAVAIAVASGGTLAIFMACLMVALSASGAMNKMTDDLAKAMSKNGATWAKAVADAIVAIATMVATMGAGGIAEGIAKAVSEAVEEAEEEVAGMIEMTVMKVIKDGVSSLEDAGEDLLQGIEELGDDAEEAVQSLFKRFVSAMGRFKDGFVDSLKENMNIFTKAGAKKTLGMSAAYWGSANGLVDSSKSVYADATHQTNVAADKVKMAEWMKILQIVMAVVQAIIQMVGVYYGGGADSDETSVMERIFGKLNKLETVSNIAVGGQIVAQGVGTYATTGLMINSIYKEQLTKNMGQNQSELAYLKATGEQRKIFEKKEIELFASQMEQQITALHTQIKKNGEAEREAALILQQSAV